MLRAVLFDLGDTLIDFEPMDAQAAFEQGARATFDCLAGRGHALPPFPRYFRATYRAVRWSYLVAKFRRREFNVLDVLDGVFRRMKVQLDRPTLEHVSWLWYEPVTLHTRLPPDVIPTLRDLRRHRFKLGLVSNTFLPGCVMDRHLRMVGLLPLLPVRIYSSEVGYRKPSRRIFQKALDELDVRAEQTAFVGDLLKPDIQGARRMGMTTVLRDPYAATGSRRGADLAIRHISDLPALIVPGC